MKEERNQNKNIITIVTHSGQFHADDIFAVATLVLALEDTHEIKIVRSRDPKIINEADYVVDVGGIYNEEKKRFDHHQEGRAGSRENGIFYSSFGLVWKAYGDNITGSSEIMTTLDKKLVSSIDARDNGLASPKPLIEDVYMYDICDFFGAYKIGWKDDEKELDINFMFCVNIAKNLLKREIKGLKDKKEAEDEIEVEYSRSKDKRLIILNKYYSRHTDMLSEYNDVLMVLSPKLMDGTWGVEMIRKDPKSYDARLYFPKSWAGKSGKELEEITGVVGSLFCHNGRFLVVARSKEAALKLAHLALQEVGK